MTRLTLAGIAAAREQSATGKPASPHGLAAGWCLWYVEEMYGVPHWYPDATAAWEGAQHRHETSDPNSIPRGVPVYWTGGSAGHGHIAISAGDGHCWSTDIKRAGFFDRCPIAQIEQQWGLRLVGWSEDLAGVTIYHPRTKATERRKPDAAVITRPERADKRLAGAENQLEDVQGPRRQRLVAPILDLVRRARHRLHRKFPDTRRNR